MGHARKPHLPPEERKTQEARDHRGGYPPAEGRSPLALPLIILLATYAKILASEEAAMAYDLARMRLLWTGPGRDGEALAAFFDDRGEERCKGIEAVCCDMWQPCMDVIEEKLPRAAVVFDKFHIAAHPGKAIGDVRREEARKLKEEGREEILSKTRYIFLENPENLTDNQRLRLSDLEKLNLKINRARVLREAFRCRERPTDSCEEL